MKMTTETQQAVVMAVNQSVMMSITMITGGFALTRTNHVCIGAWVLSHCCAGARLPVQRNALLLPSDVTCPLPSWSRC